MTNGNIETRVSAMEAQMQQIQATLQQVATLQVTAQQQINQFGDRMNQLGDRLDQIADSLKETSAIANSNARSVQAWEALIEQNRVDAEEERSVLRVELNDLKQASRENIQQHFDFRERFDRVLSEIEDLRRRMAG